MVELFKTYVKEYTYLRVGDLAAIVKLAKFKKYSAGEIVARPDVVFPYTLAIVKGMIRTYIVSTNAEEKTVRFAKENDFTSCSRSFLSNAPSTEYLQAIEDTTVIVIETEKVKKLTLENIRLMRFWNDALSKTLTDAVERIEFFISLTPQERYEELLKRTPELIHRVPQKYLASYIGVTTVSLSRIRSRLASK